MLDSAEKLSDTREQWAGPCAFVMPMHLPTPRLDSWRPRARSRSLCMCALLVMLEVSFLALFRSCADKAKQALAKAPARARGISLREISAVAARQVGVGLSSSHRCALEAAEFLANLASWGGLWVEDG